MIYKPTEEEEAASDRFHAERIAKTEATIKLAAKSDAPMKSKFSGPVVTVKSQQSALIKLANRLAAVNPTDSLTCRDAAAELRIHMADTVRLRAALQEIADLDKFGGYNTACNRARAALKTE